MTAQQKLDRLTAAVRRWALFQDPDSLEDQKRDPKLQADAIETREALLALVENDDGYDEFLQSDRVKRPRS